jgi:hypothetical protein
VEQQRIERTPWAESAHTQIWNVTEAARALPDRGMDDPADDASLAVWLVHAPWMANGMWHWHYCAVVHLRNLPGQSKQPHLEFPEATHEFISLAVDPSLDVDVHASPLQKLKFLSPVSICQQLSARNDAEALERIEHLLKHCVQGQLTLESDGRTVWKKLLAFSAAARH